MIPEQVLDRIKAMQASKISDRTPIWWDAYSIANKTIAASETGTLVSDIDCSPFALAMLYAEATFSAAANLDLTIDLRARPPGRSDYSLEPFSRGVLAFNTTSPYKRYFWLPVDVRFVDMLSIYYSHGAAAASMTLTYLGLRLVV